MATRRKSTQQRNGSSPLGYTLFGVVVGLGIAAAGAYYLRTQDTVHTQTDTSSRQSAQAVVSTAPASQSRSEPAQQASSGSINVSGVNSDVTSASPTPAPPSSTPVAVANHTKPTAKPTTQNAVNQQKPSTQSPDRIGHLIHSMNEAKPVPESKIGPTYLQVGAFKSFEEADAKRAQLLMHGFDNVSMSKTKVENTEYVRVRIGPFSDQKALKEAQSRLKAQNINASLIR